MKRETVLSTIVIISETSLVTLVVLRNHYKCVNRIDCICMYIHITIRSNLISIGDNNIIIPVYSRAVIYLIVNYIITAFIRSVVFEVKTHHPSFAIDLMCEGYLLFHKEYDSMEDIFISKYYTAYLNHNFNLYEDSRVTEKISNVRRLKVLQIESVCNIEFVQRRKTITNTNKINSSCKQSI